MPAKNSRVFFDTNIIIYSFDNSAKSKKKKALDLIADGLENGTAVISHQVIQEFTSVALNDFKKILSVNQLALFMDEVLFPLWKSYPSRETFLIALQIKNEYKFSWWDSLIVAAALETECKILYTEDMQHNFQIQTLQIVNPFN